jgi:hypothetical protein
MKQLFFRAVLSLAITLSTGAVEWYQSTPGGVPGLPIRNGKPSETGWSLSVEKSDEGEKRSLYLDGTLESRTVFVRSGGKLVAQDEYDSNGLLVSRLEYAYDADGNSRGIFINLDTDSPTGAHVETYQGANPDGAVYRHTSGAAGQWTISDFDSRGRPIKRTALSDSAVSSEISWIRDDEGNLKEEIQLTGDTELRKRYNDEGRILEETTITGGVLLQIRSYTWNGANLSRVEEKGEGRTTVRELTWTRDKLVSETLSVEGIISSEILYTSDSERTEMLYRDGVAAVRVYWDGNNRLREEFLRDGEVIRVREGGL